MYDVVYATKPPHDAMLVSVEMLAYFNWLLRAAVFDNVSNAEAFPMIRTLHKSSLKYHEENTDLLREDLAACFEDFYARFPAKPSAEKIKAARRKV